MTILSSAVTFPARLSTYEWPSHFRGRALVGIASHGIPPVATFVEHTRWLNRFEKARSLRGISTGAKVPILGNAIWSLLSDRTHRNRHHHLASSRVNDDGSLGRVT
jgi:hypothetical protein